MNTDKIQPDHTPVDSGMIHAANERNTEHIFSVNMPMKYLPLSTAFNTIDSMRWIQQGQTIFAGENVRQASDRQFRQSG